MVETNKAVSLFVIGAISLIMATVFISQAATQGLTVTDKTIIVNEVIDTSSARLGNDYNVTVNLGPVANYPTGWKVSDCPLTDIVVTNASGTALTLTTDYTLSTTTGILKMVNSTTTRAIGPNNNTLIDYTYCPDTYITQSWGRTAIDTTMGLYAIAALLVAVGMFYGAYKLTGNKY